MDYVGRRNLLKLMGAGGAGMAVTAAGGSFLWGAQQAVNLEPVAVQETPEKVSSDAALKRLIAVNSRFVQEKRQNPNQSRLRFQQTAVAQYPIAAILGCADSRVPAEIVFDQGLGDLFVVRVAGNVASQTAIGIRFSTDCGLRSQQMRCSVSSNKR